MTRKKNEKDHHNRKSSGSAEVWRKQKKARNAARPKQVTIIEKNPDGTEKITGPLRLGESFGEPPQLSPSR